MALDCTTAYIPVMQQVAIQHPVEWVPPDKLPTPERGERFVVNSDFVPAGDQPQAISELIAGLRANERDQVLLGVTGSGKTFTMAHVIADVQRPTLIMAPNKTLAAQLYGEMKKFFPDNAVEYFVSYYDYYQPEAYVPRSDTYIEKESSINEQIDRMRHSATRALLERRDVIIVASVSCIYGIGSVETYQAMTIELKVGQTVDRQQMLRDFTELQYKRNDSAFVRGAFRARGDVVELFPAHMEDRAWRFSLWDDEIEKIEEFDPLTGAKSAILRRGTGLRQQPLCHAAAVAAPGGRPDQARTRHPRLEELNRANKLLGGATAGAADDLRSGDDGGDGLVRRHRELFALPHRPPAGSTAADPVRISARDAPLLIVDESHITVPQIGGMYPRRLCTASRPGRLRLPPALLRRQPPAEVRGVGAPCGRKPCLSPPRQATGSWSAPRACSPNR